MPKDKRLQEEFQTVQDKRQEEFQTVQFEKNFKFGDDSISSASSSSRYITAQKEEVKVEDLTTQGQNFLNSILKDRNEQYEKLRSL